MDELAIIEGFLQNLLFVLTGIWLRRHRDELDIMPFHRRKDYYGDDEDNYKYYGWGLEIFFTFLMAVIVYQIMIPIALYISMELVRIGQAFFRINDDNMYDESTESRF
ncbi:phospholipid-transporting ATPase 1-like protein [Tanacetum coccineum]